MKNTSQKTLDLVQLSLFAAIIILMAFTPFLGYIPLGFTRATIIHVPVIVGCILLGPKKGAVLGFIFGLTSLFNNTFNPTLTSFVFSPFYSVGEIHGNLWSLVICFVPRILVGVIPYYVYRALSRVTAKNLSLAVAGLAGSLTNTLLVMNLIFFCFKDAYAAANSVSANALYAFILTIIGMNGIPEAIVASIITVALCRVLLKLNVGQPSKAKSAILQ